ncbi:pyroglutamyl-peptidase I [Humibacter sp. RRB41]|uniref:pyroglutamyl-peptidase I n=1 Tax=Humibacter sp. RRB41 TaxID=2919946 RepID=UPI001FA961C6|nr:pyroglutamyl-peptidase I [Humibacter sp. RRB41]
MTTALLTGFEPFAGDARNPSAEAVHLVADAWNGPQELVTAVLPTAFGRSAERLAELLAEHSPDVVIATGLAGGRAWITPERVAVNLIDARVPDNDGQQPVDEPSLPGAPAAYFSTLPVKPIVNAIAAAGIPARPSLSAGAFVCNHVFFRLMDAVTLRAEGDRVEATGGAGIRAGFIHLRWAVGLGGPAEDPALPLEDIVRGLEIALRATLDAR